MEKEKLKLIRKCHDPEEYGYLYGLNQEIPEEEMEKAKQYMTHFKPATFKNVMKIEGNPHGWMCTYENAPLVEEALNITETLQKQEEQRKNQRQYYDEHRKEKEDAQIKVENAFANKPRPRQKLRTLLNVAQVTYDPANSFRDNNHYGGGHLFIVTKKSIWYIMNNGRDEDNWNINNIEIEGKGGAIGFKHEYTEELHDLIKVLTENNEYSGDTYIEEY
ncbi:hypothetical protein [Methanosphaera sp.]